jgi:hypothetical protein
MFSYGRYFADAIVVGAQRRCAPTGNDVPMGHCVTCASKPRCAPTGTGMGTGVSTEAVL